MTIKEKQIKLNDLTINYVESGSGIPIIFLHNGGGFWQSWIHQINFFSKKNKVYALDLPSFGGSDSPDDEKVTLNLITDILESFIQVKSLKNVNLVGNCIGGSVALLYNIRYPENVNRLIIFNICPGIKIYRSRVLRVILPRVNSYPVLKNILTTLFTFICTKTIIERQFPKILFGKNVDINSFLYKYYKKKFKEKKQNKGRANLVFTVHTFNLDVILQQQKAPKHLLVWGKENKVVPYKRLFKYHKDLLKPEKTITLDNVGHLCMYEKPAEVTNIIEKYINQHPIIQYQK